MLERGLNKFYWGFIFIMLGFRIQGIDILPDIVGYLFLASGFSDVISSSSYFSTVAKYNIPMTILSIFSIYQRPAQGTGIDFGPMGIFIIPIAIASFVLSLLVMYYLFMGIKDVAEKQGQSDLANESDKRWNQYKMLQFAVLFSFIIIFIPFLNVVYVIVLFILLIILLIGILGFIKNCIITLT